VVRRRCGRDGMARRRTTAAVNAVNKHHDLISHVSRLGVRFWK